MELAKKIESFNILKKVSFVLIGTLLLTISAKIKVPFYPVPMTMQTFVVVLIGITLGWKLGLATVLTYLFEGAIGLPVFAGTPEKGIGISYMMGPTGGYLIGFVFSVFIGIISFEQCRLNDDEGINVRVSCKSTSIKTELIL